MENKERLSKLPERETGLKITEVSRRPEEAPTEIKRWIDKIEEDPAAMKPVLGDNGQPLLHPIGSSNPKIVLPQTRTAFVSGFKQKVNQAGKWLSTFVLRLIKIKDGEEVKFQEE